MARICEISRKRVSHFSNLPEADRPDPKAYRRILLKRKVKVPEIKGAVNLWVTEAGLKEVKSAGGLAKFLKDRDDKKLTPKLLKLKRKIHGEPKSETPAAAEASASAPAAPAEAAPKEAAAKEAPPTEAAPKEAAGEAPKEPASES